MSEQSKKKPEKDLAVRLDKLISEMEHHKEIKDLANNYHIVLQEMKNLRDGVLTGN